MVFSDNVYRIIKTKKMNQSAVARACGMKPNEFNAILKGRKLLREEHVLPICKALEVTPNDLFNTQHHHTQ